MSRHAASNGKPFMTDFLIADHGSIVTIRPVSEHACEWLDDNVVAEPWQWFGGALCIEHRCAPDILAAIAHAGFDMSP